MKSCTSPSPEMNIRNIPVVTLICLARCFQKLMHTPSHRLSLPPMILHARRNLRHLSRAVKEVESVIPKRLHHLFFFVFLNFSPHPGLPKALVWECIYPDFPSNPIKHGSRGAVTAKHVSAGANGKEASRQIKAKRSLNLLITQRCCHW